MFNLFIIFDHLAYFDRLYYLDHLDHLDHFDRLDHLDHTNQKKNHSGHMANKDCETIPKSKAVH